MIIIIDIYKILYIIDNYCIFTGTGKTQSIVTLCDLLPCPIVVGSTNPCSVNVAQRCQSAFPYRSCVQAQLSGTAWSAMHWNIGTEMIGHKREKALHNIYTECVQRKTAPTHVQDKQIYTLLNQCLFKKMREKFENECKQNPQKKIYAAWDHARTGSLSFSTQDKAMQELYDMFCSVPQEAITQEDFNTALAFRCLTAFTEQLPRPLLSNFWVIEEAARLPAYFFRIVAFYHYMVRWHIKPPGYRNTMLTIYCMGSPLQSSVIGFPDFSLMDEAILDAKQRNTHVSIYTVNRRTVGNSEKANALATVVQTLENDCQLKTEHCRLLDPFVVPEEYFMDPTYAPSAMRLTHYHRRVKGFIDKANNMKDDVVTFCEYIFVSEGVKPKPASKYGIKELLSNKGPVCLPYRNTRAKDIRNEGVLPVTQPMTAEMDEEPIIYKAFSMKRTLGKNTPVTIQHTTNLIPVDFRGTYRSFHNYSALSHSCSEQLWSLRIELSFASMLCRSLSEEESYILALTIDDVWVKAYTYSKDLFSCGLSDVEHRASISACINEVQDLLWKTVVETDMVGFVDEELRVKPFTGGQYRYFPCTIVRGDRYPGTFTLEDVVEVAPSDIEPGTHNVIKHIPRTDGKRREICNSLFETIHTEVFNRRMQLHDLLLRNNDGILFKTVNILLPDRWCKVFPTSQFTWDSVIDVGVHEGEPVQKKARKGFKSKKDFASATGIQENTEDIQMSKHSILKDVEGASLYNGSDDEEDSTALSKEECSSVLYLLHPVYDSRVRTIDSVQGDTIRCATFVDVGSIETMGQLTVALTRNTDPDLLMLTSSNITGIKRRDPITKFVRLSSRDINCYYIK